MKELAKGIRINILGNIFRLSRSGFFVMGALLYGTENFGAYTLAYASLELLLRFGLMGLDHGLLFELAHFYQSGDDRLYKKIASSLKACLALSLLEAVLLALYTHFFVDGEQIRISLYILVPVLPIYTVGILLLQATMGLKDMKYNTSIRSIIEPGSLILFALFFYKTPLKPYGLVITQALSHLLASVLAFFAFRKYFSIKKLAAALWKRGHYWTLVSYSFPMHFIEVVDTIFYRMDIFLISAFLGTGSIEQKKVLGIYGLAKQVARVMTQTKNAFVPIFVSVTSEAYLRKELANLLAQLRYATEKILFLNIGLGLFLAGFGYQILHIFGKDIHLISQATFLWLLMGQFAYSTFSPLMFFLVAVRKSKTLIVFQVAILGFAYALGSYLVEKMGVEGVALVLGIGYSLISFTVITEKVRHFRKNFLTPRSLGSVGAGLLSGALIYFFRLLWPLPWNQTMALLPSLILGLLLYFSLTLFKRKVQ